MWVGAERCVQDFGGGVLRVKGHVDDLSVDGRIITKHMSMKWNGETWTGLIWLRIRRSTREIQ